MNDFCTQSCTTRIKNIEMKSFETSRKLVWCWAQALHIKDYKISELEWRMFSWYFCLVGQICWPIRARYKMISRGRGCSEFFLGNQSANNLQTCAPWYISKIKYFVKLCQLWLIFTCNQYMKVWNDKKTLFYRVSTKICSSEFEGLQLTL